MAIVGFHIPSPLMDGIGGIGSVTFGLVNGLLTPFATSDRYRLGDEVPLSFTSPDIPDAAPSATIAGPSPSTRIVAAVPLWTRDGGATFEASVLLGPSFGVGTFLVTATFEVAGRAVAEQVQFDVVSGGDPSGGLIAMHAHEGVPARSVIVQSSNGSLLQGQSPWA